MLSSVLCSQHPESIKMSSSGSDNVGQGWPNSYVHNKSGIQKERCNILDIIVLTGFKIHIRKNTFWEESVFSYCHLYVTVRFRMNCAVYQISSVTWAMWSGVSEVPFTKHEHMTGSSSCDFPSVFPCKRRDMVNFGPWPFYLWGKRTFPTGNNWARRYCY